MCENVNINVSETNETINIVSSEIQEVIDINVFETTEDVTLNITEEIIQVNINKVTGSEQIQSDWAQTDNEALDFIKNKPTIPDAVTNTSDLINDGEDGVNPFITANDIPPVTGFVPYTGATDDVNLGTHDLTATQGTFATSGNPDTLTVNHSSGSGKALTITKGGAGEGIYVNKTSGSGNAVTIVGDLEATNLKRTGGTSSQFLKADGSVDSNTYFELPALTSGSVLFSNGTTIAQDNANLFWDDTNNRLGIGTATPAQSLHISGNVNSGFSGLNISNSSAGNAAISTILVSNNTGAFTIQAIGSGFTGSGMLQPNSARFRTSANLTNGFYFGTGNPAPITFFTADIEKMRLFANGNFAIGTTTDAGFRLDVNGTARVKAQSALSTEVTFSVRNSANTRNFLVVNGAGDVFNNGAGGVTSNTFFGENVGRSATGTNNTLIGNAAGRDITTGAFNTIVGTTAGRLITTGVSNALFGTNAGFSIIGSQNTHIGVAAGINSTTGNQNVFLGLNSGAFISDGVTNNGLVNNSLFLGYNTKALANNQTNQIVIGHNAIGIGSNSVVLGNDSITKTALKGNVLINTTSDGGYRLDVNGTARVSGKLTMAANIEGANGMTIGSFNNPSAITFFSNQIKYSSSYLARTGTVHTFSASQFNNLTSGQNSFTTFSNGFNPVSGTGIWNLISLDATINQTGTANGITRGLYINPTLTSAADFRAIETTNGKVIFGNLPTSATGLPTGAIWNDSGTLKIV